MAEGQIKQILEKEVSCPLCLEIFKEPKKLPCDHVYCKECLIKLSQRSLNAIISCPECRIRTPIPSNDVIKFPTAFYMNRLIEAFQRVHVEMNHSPAPKTGDSCVNHSTQPLVIYCETCKKVLCRDCVLKSNEHATHRYGFFDELALKYRKKIVNLLSLVTDRESLLSNSLKEITSGKEIVVSHGKKCQDDIDRAFEGLLSVVEECKTAMKLEAAEHYHSLTSVLEQQSQDIEEVESELVKLSTSVSTHLQDDDQKFLLNIESTVTNFLKLEKQLKTVIPLVVPTPQLLTTQFVSTEMLHHLMKTTCSLHNAANPPMCSIHGILTKAELQENSDNILLLTLRDMKGNTCRGGDNRVEADLVNVDGSIVKGNVEQVSPGRMKITLRPKRRGKYKLSVTVNNDQILNSPFTTTVNIPPKSLSFPVATISGLKRPSSLISLEDKVLVTETKENRIIAIDFERHVQEFQTMFSVNKLTLDTAQNIYATTAENHKLHKLNKEGNKIKAIGGFGTQNAEFNTPSGLRVNKSSELFVCDSQNSRIQVFDLELNFKRLFGRKGNGKGCFKFPSDIDFDSSGNICIVDSDNNCIQVFTCEEQHIRTIENQKHNVRFSRPVGLLVHSSHIYVTNTFKHDVVVMDMTGEVVTFFGEGHLSWPEGITVDKDGYIYVTSLHSVVIF